MRIVTRVRASSLRRAQLGGYIPTLPRSMYKLLGTLIHSTRRLTVARSSRAQHAIELYTLRHQRNTVVRYVLDRDGQTSHQKQNR